MPETPAPAGVILLVEDNLDDVVLTRWAFARSGITHEIIVARDGSEALDLLLPSDGRLPLRPTIILLDVNMPGLGGFDVLARLRADLSTASLPVVMLTSSRHDQDMVASYRLGANSYVTKPVSPQDFLAAATTLGVYWLDVHQQPTPPPAGSRDL